MNNLSENLKKIRKEHNLSQEQLAEKLGVSRQSVSKWESNQSYPEMDKLVQLSKLYNLNFDDLINNDISKVNKNDSNISKYTNSFLEFITDTINMFIHMNLKSKIKCIFEQLLIIFILYICFSFLGLLGEGLLRSIFYPIFNDAYHLIYVILHSFYILMCTVLSVFILVYIFKTRYLNYYDSIKSQNKEEKKEHTKDIELKDQNEKIIIRDPNNSEYNLLNKFIKCILLLIKIIVLSISSGFCLSLIFFGFIFITSFLIIKTKFVFLGSIICSIACIVMNSDILILFFNFVLDRKSNKKLLIYTFVASLILFGIGSGLFASGITNFNYVDVNEINNKSFIVDEFNLEMNDSLIIHDRYNYFDIQYKEENRNDIRIVSKHSKFIDFNYEKNDNIVYFDYELKEKNIFKIFRDELKYINKMQIIDYSKTKITIYASKENILKLKNNNTKLYHYSNENNN